MNNDQKLKKVKEDFPGLVSEPVASSMIHEALGRMAVLIWLGNYALWRVVYKDKVHFILARMDREPEKVKIDRPSYESDFAYKLPETAVVLEVLDIIQPGTDWVVIRKQWKQRVKQLSFDSGKIFEGDLNLPGRERLNNEGQPRTKKFYATDEEWKWFQKQLSGLSMREQFVKVSNALVDAPDRPFPLSDGTLNQ